MNARAERFPLFDSLRALAALSVLAYHAAFWGGIAGSGSPLRPYTNRLDVGVSVFFLISGFLLYRPFVRARLAGQPLPATGPYAWRRFLRIAPAYWVALTVVALWLPISDVFSGAHWPLYYGFAQIYNRFTTVGGLGQAWTLCVEVTFYAFLPLWALAMRALLRRRGVRAELMALAVLWLASLAWKVYALKQVDPSALGNGTWLMPLPNFLDQFALGMAVAALSIERPRAARVIDERPWLPLILAAVAFWAVSTQVGLDGPIAHHIGPRAFLWRHELYSLVALCVLLPAVFGWERRDAVRRVLAWRPLLYVGLVSYGVYLWHDALITKIARGLHRHLGVGVELRFVIYTLLGTAATVAVATLSYRLVERPALSLKRLGGEPAPEQPQEALAEPAPPVPG